MTIRWDEQANGDWHGLSGELIVALVVPDPGGKASHREPDAPSPTGKAAKPKSRGWLWEVNVQRPPGWRAEGRRASALAARRSADTYWTRWCEAAALKPDIERLVRGAEGAEPAPTLRSLLPREQARTRR